MTSIVVISVFLNEHGTTIRAMSASSAHSGGESDTTGVAKIVYHEQSSSRFMVQLTLIRPPSSSGVSQASMSSIGSGAVPSSIPPVGTMGPMMVAFSGSCWPLSSTQVNAAQNGWPAPPGGLTVVLLPASCARSILRGRPIGLPLIG